MIILFKITNNIIHLQNQGVDKFTISPTANNCNQNLNMNSNIISFNSGQTEIKNNNIVLTNGINDSVHISTINNTGTNWIGLSVGTDAVGLHNRVVIGELNGEATIGGHLFSGNSIVGWSDLCLACEGGNVKINDNIYSSANNLSCAGNIDVQTSYKINNNTALNENNLYLKNGANTSILNTNCTSNTTFSLPDKGTSPQTLACLSDIGGSSANVLSYSFYPKIFSTGGLLQSINQYWIFPGTTIMPLSKIFVCFGLDTSTSTQIQIIDQNSTLIIADRTITTGGLQIIDMGTLTNMNTLNTIWTIKISTSIAAQSTLYYLLMKV